MIADWPQCLQQTPAGVGISLDWGLVFLLSAGLPLTWLVRGEYPLNQGTLGGNQISRPRSPCALGGGDRRLEGQGFRVLRFRNNEVAG